LRAYTQNIPIIFANVADPIGSGFVASFSRPGGNVTGFVNLEGSLGGKWLELLKEIAPGVHRVAFLFNPITAPFADYFPARAEETHQYGNLKFICKLETNSVHSPALAAVKPKRLRFGEAGSGIQSALGGIASLAGSAPSWGQTDVFRS
jgi:ABC transporter substrate binding protein